MSNIEIEVRATRTNGEGDIEWCRADEAEQFSVYIGKPGAFRCIDDCPTEAMAMNIARTLGNEWEVEVHDHIERVKTIPDEAINEAEARLAGAYVLLGFQRTASKQCWEIACKHGGEIELVNSLVTLGMEVERVWMENQPADAAGVWLSFSAEPLGAWLAEQAVANGELPDYKDAMVELRRLAREFFEQ